MSNSFRQARVCRRRSAQLIAFVQILNIQEVRPFLHHGDVSYVFWPTSRTVRDRFLRGRFKGQRVEIVVSEIFFNIFNNFFEKSHVRSVICVFKSRKLFFNPERCPLLIRYLFFFASYKLCTPTTHSSHQTPVRRRRRHSCSFTSRPFSRVPHLLVASDGPFSSLDTTPPPRTRRRQSGPPLCFELLSYTVRSYPPTVGSTRRHLISVTPSRLAYTVRVLPSLPSHGEHPI